MSVHKVRPGYVGMQLTIEAQEGCVDYPLRLDGKILWVGRESFVFAQPDEYDQIMRRNEWKIIIA